MFTIEMLPARHGDCLWIEYGSKKDPQRILVDTGIRDSFNPLAERIQGIEGGRRFELLVLTHVDDDHIGGVLRLLRGLKQLKVEFGDIWFNGYRHLAEGLLGGPEGEELTSLLDKLKLPWNKLFDDAAIVVPDHGPLPIKKLPSGIQLTLLSPRRSELESLIPKWEAACRRAGLIPGKGVKIEPIEEGDEGILGEIDPDALAIMHSDSDPSESNASSIGLIATWEGQSVLLSGDAHSDVLLAGLERLPEPTPISIFKLPHHGSQGNVTKDLVEKVGAQKYLVSTDGIMFKHPSRQAIARVLVTQGHKDLYFNYRSKINTVWGEKEDWIKHFDYKPFYPPRGKAGLVADLT
jgi:hypothetical protein